MRDINVTAPEMIDKAWTVPINHKKPRSMSTGRRLGGQTKKVTALVAKIKMPPKLRWW